MILDDPHGDELERTQRLPIVGGVCNCPSEQMIVHVIGCPLRHTGPAVDRIEIDSFYRVTVHGRPLSELGLDGAIVVHPDGRSEPLIGIYFHRWEHHQSLLYNIRAAFGEQYPGCKLVFGPL